MIPGSNLLAQAMTLIGRQTVTYLPAPGLGGYTVGPSGLVAEAPRVPETVPGCSVQPVPRARYNDLGLDFTREYVEVWMPRNVRGVERTRAPDQLVWGGTQYAVESVTQWHGMDGWSRALCVALGPYVPPEQPGGSD